MESKDNKFSVSVDVEFDVEDLRYELEELVKERRDWILFNGAKPEDVTKIKVDGRKFKGLLRKNMKDIIKSELPYLVSDVVFDHLFEVCDRSLKKNGILNIGDDEGLYFRGIPL